MSLPRKTQEQIPVPTPERQEERLAGLARLLDPGVFKTQMSLSGTGQPELRIINRTARQLSESVGVSGEEYVWSWGQVIALVTVPELAAQRISRVLATEEG
ncbi:hypothetical protein [Actinomadura monticuli]|uniref:Uncharacterized protein n=1 Tax=Actinomadura monticuli TaxID=3097367 RepID=A0ABV4Q608_9ACTN